VTNPIASLGSNANYLLTNGCNSIRGLEVFLKADQTLVSDKGFSVQLNAYNPAGPTTSWMQFILGVSNNAITGDIQYWNMAGFYNCLNTQCGGSLACATTPGPTGCTGPTIWLNQPPVTLPVTLPLPPSSLPLLTNTLPAGWTLGIQLSNDISGNITGATFTATDNGATPTTYTASTILPLNLQFPIKAFEVNVVGPGSGAKTTFSSGAGTITYFTTDTLCVEGGLPDACSKSAGSGTGTGETSNATYGSVSPCCGASLLTQSLDT